MLLRVGRHGVEKLNIVDSASLSPKWRRTMVPIIIGEMPTNAANSRSSGKKVAEEEEEEGGGEGPEFADSSALGDLDRLASPHQGPGHSGRSVSPLRLSLPQRQPKTKESFSQTPSGKEGGAHVSQDLVEIPLTTESSVNDKDGGELKETQTENVCSEEQEVQTEEAEGEDEGTQTIPVAMSQANSQTDPSPIQVAFASF